MTYEYECTACKHAWEIEQKITEPALTECPKCQQSTARRLISSSGAFTLTGDGWFKTGGY
jgi:putative FmdB family regulatory protein